MTQLRPRERSALRVLDFVWREGPVSRVDVVRGTELSRATVSKLIGELQSRELIAERHRPAPERSDAVGGAGGIGRPPALLEVDPRAGAVGGVDFGHSSVRVALADLAGTLIAEDRHELDVDNEAERAIALAVDGLGALRASGGLARTPLLGVGAAISAPVRRDRGTLAAPGILPGWSSVSPRCELEARLGVPVAIGNDANLGALAEVRAGAARGASNVVYVMLSSGVGGGLVLNGALFTGHGGVTGELGHVVVDPDGRICRCGNRGCLETVAGAQRVLAGLRASVQDPDLTLELAAELAARGDERCQAPFRDAGRAAGRVAGAICNLVNPELVIVGGDLIVAGAVVVDAVRDGIEQTSIPAVRRDLCVVAATLGDQAELLGAIGLAIARADIGALARR